MSDGLDDDIAEVLAPHEFDERTAARQSELLCFMRAARRVATELNRVRAPAAERVPCPVCGSDRKTNIPTWRW